MATPLPESYRRQVSINCTITEDLAIQGSFINCDKITEAIIDSNVINVFRGSSVTNVTMKSTVDIDNSVFSECLSLSEVIYSANKLNFMIQGFADAPV